MGGGMPDMGGMGGGMGDFMGAFMQDPELMQAMQDPEVAAALMDLKSNPGTAALFVIGFDRFSCNPKRGSDGPFPSVTSHARCDMVYSVPTLVGC